MKISGYIRIFILSLIMSASIMSCAYGPAHGHVRASFYYPFGYYYYPSVRVYFHYPTGYYFYLSGNTWVRTRVLPHNIHLSPSERVHLDINSNKPYLYNKEHSRMYVPRQNYKSSAEQDKNERKSHREWYKEQQEYKKKKRFNDKDKDERMRR